MHLQVTPLVSALLVQYYLICFTRQMQTVMVAQPNRVVLKSFRMRNKRRENKMILKQSLYKSTVVRTGNFNWSHSFNTTWRIRFYRIAASPNHLVCSRYVIREFSEQEMSVTLQHFNSVITSADSLRLTAWKKLYFLSEYIAMFFVVQKCVHYQLKF